MPIDKRNNIDKEKADNQEMITKKGSVLLIVFVVISIILLILSVVLMFGTAFNAIDFGSPTGNTAAIIVGAVLLGITSILMLISYTVIIRKHREK